MAKNSFIIKYQKNLISELPKNTEQQDMEKVWLTQCHIWFDRSSRSQMFFKIGVLKNFTSVTEKTPVLESNESLIQVLSCKIYDIFKNNYFHRTPPVPASGLKKCSPARHSTHNVFFNSSEEIRNYLVRKNSRFY